MSNRLGYFLEWLMHSWNNEYWREDYHMKICDHEWEIICLDDIGKMNVCNLCGQTKFES